MEVAIGPTTVFVLATRKPGTTFEHFKLYYENNHAPLVSSLICSSENRPLTYNRNYIERDGGTPASFPTGGAETWDYDCICRVTFRDVEHRDAFFKEFAAHQQVVGEDEKKFLDQSKLRIVYAMETPAHVRT